MKRKRPTRPLVPIFLLCISVIRIFGLYKPSKHCGKLLEYAKQGKHVIVEGIVLEHPYLIKNTERFRCRVSGEDVLAVIYGCKKGVHLKPGDRIALFCKIREIKNLKNPASFDYSSYMAQMGIFYKAYISGPRNVHYLGKGTIPFPYCVEERVKGPIREFFKKNLNKTDFSLYSALILGEKRGLDPEIKEMINSAGLGHILAVSGLHVGLVAWSFFVFIRWLILRSYRLALMFDSRKLAAALTIAPVLGYCLISGLRIPTQRAMIMVLVFLFSILLDKQEDVISSLCLAGILILLINPASMLSASFQLSFISVAGIVWLMPYVKKHLEIINIKRFSYLFDLICVSISAVIVLFPLMLYYFFRFPLLSIPANITVVPLLGLWILPAGLISIAVLPFSSFLASLFLKIGACGIHLMLFMVRLWSSIPFSSIWLFKPNLLEVLLYYVLLFFLFEIKGRKFKTLGVVFVCTIFLIDFGYWTYRNRFHNDVRITLLDAGRSYVSLLELPYGKNIIVASSYLSPYLEKMVIIPFLCYSRIRKLSYIVASDPSKLSMVGKIFCAKRVKGIKESINGALIKADKNELYVLYNGISVFLKRCGKKGVLIRSADKSIVYDPSKKGALLIRIKNSVQLNHLRSCIFF